VQGERARECLSPAPRRRPGRRAGEAADMAAAPTEPLVIAFATDGIWLATR
jgi:hypothetical protein